MIGWSGCDQKTSRKKFINKNFYPLNNGNLTLSYHNESYSHIYLPFTPFMQI